MYYFRFFKDYRDALECPSFESFRHELRCYEPCVTTFRAISQGIGRYIVLRFSPYIMGPVIEGYLTVENKES